LPEKVDLAAQRKKNPIVKSGNNTISTSGESSYSDERVSAGSLNSIQFAADKSKKASGIAQLSSMADNYSLGSRNNNSSGNNQQKIIQRVVGDDLVADDSAKSAPSPVSNVVSDEIAAHVLAKSGVIPEEEVAQSPEVPAGEIGAGEEQADAAASSETEAAPELGDAEGGDIESQALPVEATRTLRTIDIIDEHIQDKSPDQNVSDKVLPAQQAGAKVAKSNNEETGRVQADSLLVKTKSMVMAVEAKKKKEEAAPAIELPTSEIDSSGDEDLQESQEFENAVAADISPKDEALLKDAEAPKVDSIIGELAGDLLRIKAIADSKNELNVIDLKIIQAASEKIRAQPVTKFMVTNLFTIIDKISADITDGRIDLVYYDAEGNRIVMNKEGEILSSFAGAINDVSNLASQVGWGGGENSGVSNLGTGEGENTTNPIYKSLIDWQAGLSDDDMLLLSGVSDTTGAAVGLAGTFVKFKNLSEQCSPENWAKKNSLEKAKLVAEITGTFTQGLSGLGKGSAGVMDSLGIWQETNATSVFSGEALMSSSGQMSGTSSIKYVGDIAGVAAGGLDFVASSFSAINDFKKWKAKNKEDWNNPFKHKEAYSKSLLTAAKLTQSAAGVARDAYRVALHTGAVSAAQELTTTAAATGASVAVGGLTAIRAAYLLRKYKGRKHKLGEEKEKLDPAVQGNVEKKIVMTDLESVLQKKINRAYVNLAGSALEITAGALALSGFGSIVGIGLAALLGASKLVYTAGKGFRQWRRDVQARKRLETYENWKERQEAKVALDGGGVKRSVTKAITTKSGYASKQDTAGETYAEWKARKAGRGWLIKTTSNWDKATGAKELKYVEIAQAIKKFNDPTLYTALGLDQTINGQKDHDHLVIEKLKSRA